MIFDGAELDVVLVVLHHGLTFESFEESGQNFCPPVQDLLETPALFA
jgi:hypothetical protein